MLDLNHSAAEYRRRKFDEYGDIRFNDEKARLDNYAIQLQNEPGIAPATIVVFGNCAGAGQAQRRSREGLPGQHARYRCWPLDGCRWWLS